MTEEQKMQWLKGLIENGANIAQINLGDGTQNFYVGDSDCPHRNDDVPDAEEVEIPVVDDRKKEYPVITDVQTRFFEPAFVIKGEVYGQKPTVLDMPIEWIMHVIHDQTADWNPSESTSVHKWKLLYETLKRLKYFRIEQKHRYADFVRAVVRYCFPNVADSYSNNISKSYLNDKFEDWSHDDKVLYKSLKEALSFQK